MDRRTFLGALGSAPAVKSVPVWTAHVPPAAVTVSETPPRKVLVGTVIQPFWEEYPGLEKRLDQLSGIVGRMAREASRSHGRPPDLAILPETAVTGEAGANVQDHAIALEGVLSETFSRVAREYSCYIVVPTYLREGDRCFNVGILFDRQGKIAGIYRKVHLAVAANRDSLEAGTTPGREFPVFQCDFGKLGIQICFDIEFDEGWRELARQGVEIVAWPTQSPQTSHPGFRALRHRCYIISSTWRRNASIFEPTGKIAAQVTASGEVLVRELDLSYAIVPWSSQLRNGEALRMKYGERVGYHYYEDEDSGIFWSNDPQVPIAQMLRSIGVSDVAKEMARIGELYRKAGVPGF